MRNKSLIILESIKTNNEIVSVLKKKKKINLSSLTIWITKQSNPKKIQYALLVGKNQFKLAVCRNKIKRQLRNILINTDVDGGIKLLLKPNSSYLNKTYSNIQNQIISSIKQYQNGK